MRRLAGVPGLLSVLVVSMVAIPSSARAVNYQIQSQLVGDGYQLVTSDNEVLNRRRAHVYLGLGAYDLLSDGEHKLSIHTLMRFDAAFGLGQDDVDRMYSFDRHQLSIMSAFVQGRDLAGFFDFTAGRFVHYDPIDFQMLDGVRMTFNTPWYFGVEVLAGLEAKHDTNPITTNPAELDGVRFIEDKTRPNEDQTIVIGAALVSKDLPWTRVRLGYRRLMDVGGRVDQEKIGLGFYQRAFEILHLGLNASYDFYINNVDRVQAHIRATVADAIDIETQYVRLVPVFDTDSIFNIFASEPLNDVNLKVRWHLGRQHRVYVGGKVRLFSAETAPERFPIVVQPDDLVTGYGVMAGWWKGWDWDGRVGVDVSYEDGWAGQRVFVDVAGMYAPLPRQLELEARLTLVHFDEDLIENLSATSFGYQVAVRYKIDELVGLMVLLEHNINRLQTHQVRAWGVVDFNVFL